MTFTASQGLLLMIPNTSNTACELTSTVFHVAARSLAAQGLSIFETIPTRRPPARPVGAQLFASSVQEAADFALISQAAALEARVPFLHVFDRLPEPRTKCRRSSRSPTTTSAPCSIP